MLHRQAEAVYREHSNNNAFGLDNEKWDNRNFAGDAPTKRHRDGGGFSPYTWIQPGMGRSGALLRGLNELGARPLLLSMPIHGGWYDYLGVTYTARRAYYESCADECRAITFRSSTSPITMPIGPSVAIRWAPRSQGVAALRSGPRRFFSRRDRSPVGAVGHSTVASRGSKPFSPSRPTPGS